MASKRSSNTAIDLDFAEPPADEALDRVLDGFIGYAMRHAQIKVFQHLVNTLASYDLRPAQFTSLAIIGDNPGLMQVDLARTLAIEPPQAVTLLNKLETRGLAVRVRCKPDKRSYGIFLTKAGEALLEQLKGVVLQSDLEATAALSEDERQQLLALLQKVYR